MTFGQWSPSELSILTVTSFTVTWFNAEIRVFRKKRAFRFKYQLFLWSSLNTELFGNDNETSVPRTTLFFLFVWKKQWQHFVVLEECFVVLSPEFIQDWRGQFMPNVCSLTILPNNFSVLTCLPRSRKKALRSRYFLWKNCEWKIRVTWQRN